MKLKFTNDACEDLVEARQTKWENTMFITISPNPNVKHNVNRRIKDVKMKYGEMPQRLQYSYCIEVLDKLMFYFSEDSYLIGTWELNKTGNLHLHFIIDDPVIKNDTHLDILRREIACSDEALRNKKNGKDYMHNIVFVNDSVRQRCVYMDKDFNKNSGIFSNYYYDGPPVQTNNLVAKPLVKPNTSNPKVKKSRKVKIKDNFTLQFPSIFSSDLDDLIELERRHKRKVI